MSKKRRNDANISGFSIFDLVAQIEDQGERAIIDNSIGNGNYYQPNGPAAHAPVYPSSASYGPAPAQNNAGNAIMDNGYDVHYTEQILHDEKPSYQNGETLVGTSIVIGKRSSQQDAIGTSQSMVQSKAQDPWIGVLCDGMGGMNAGEMASSLSVEETLKSFFDVKDVPNLDVPMFYRTLIDTIDTTVSGLEDANGNDLGAGTTFTSIMLYKGSLYWASVGDSHIYIIRNNQIKMVVEEHNYLRDLLAMAERGEIAEREAYADKSKDALTSYIGIGGVTLMNVSNAFRLQPGDIALLCSDGLYRSLSEEEIHRIVLQHYYNMQQAADALTSSAIKKNNPYQDNTSVVLLKYL